MKTVVIEIELEVDDNASNLGVAESLELTLMHNDYGKPNYVVCRNKHRHSAASSTSRLPADSGSSSQGS